MELIFGGAYQGKTQYAAQKYDLTDADIFTCEYHDLDPDALCIRHLERFRQLQIPVHIPQLLVTDN